MIVPSKKWDAEALLAWCANMLCLLDQISALQLRSVPYWSPRQFILHRCAYGWYNRVSGGNFADRHFSESQFHMKQAYLLLASERRVLNVVLDDDLDAIQRAIGYQTIEHGTTFQTEDQLIIGGDELGGVPKDRFWAAGVPFAFHGNALLVGIDPLTGDTARSPADDDRRIPAADHLCHTVT